MAYQHIPEDFSSDGGKRFKRSSRTRNRTLIYIVSPLLFLGVGIAYAVSDTFLNRPVEVKDSTSTLPSLGEIAVDQAPEVVLQEKDQSITIYTVAQGDTLSEIADKFSISVNTIRWANDLTEKNSKIKIGDELVILPVSGIEYTVRKGDTLSAIATRYDADQEDILKYNDIEKNAIKVGAKIIIPGAEPLTPQKPAAKKPAQPVTQQPSSKTTTEKEVVVSKKEDAHDDEYSVPVSSGILTQGIHDGNAVDFGVPVGTTIKSFKEGTVLVAKSSGYNGGYGNYIVINHGGSCQTQYSHLSSVAVTVGEKVSMGQFIGFSGNTGRSTGPHLHFNVRNCGGNPFAKYKVGTRF